MKCINPDCAKETNNPKFCSRSCAAIVNNRSTPKRQPEHNCLTCKKRISNLSRYCSEECKQKGRMVVGNKYLDSVYSTKTLGDLQKQSGDQNKYVRLRNHAQKVFKYSGLDYACCVCGYDKHIEICHLKPINEFSTDVTLTVVNDINNLVALCPNCHWELDNYHIAIEQSY